MKIANILSVASCIATASAALGKTAWLPELGPTLNPGLSAKLPSKASTAENPWASSIPKACRDTTNKRSECKPSEMEVFDVTYPDCSSPWVMCRCPRSPMSKQTIKDVFGQLPVQLRSSVRHLMAFPKAGGKGCNAFASGGDIVFFGDCANKTTPSVFIHEAAHTRDKGYSGKTILPAANSDKCVPDNYANTNEAEDFAQLMVVHLHNLDNASPKPTDCMSNQMEAMTRDWPASKLWPAICDLSIKPRNSDSVPKTDETSVPRSLDERPAQALPVSADLEDFGVVV